MFSMISDKNVHEELYNAIHRLTNFEPDQSNSNIKSNQALIALSF
jgi:hypothetical protein